MKSEFDEKKDFGIVLQITKQWKKLKKNFFGVQRLGNTTAQKEKKCNCSFVDETQNVKYVIFPETKDFSGNEKDLSIQFFWVYR